MLSMTSSVLAENSFIQIQLPHGVTVELPRNWVVLSENQRVTIEAFTQAKSEKFGVVDPSNDLTFAANYYADDGKTAVIFNVRYYPAQTVTQTDAIAASTDEIKELDDALHKGISQSLREIGSLLAWNGTTKKLINGKTVFISDYRRMSALSTPGAAFHSRLIRIFNGNKSFTVTISYREDLQLLLEPICDRVIGTIGF